VARAWFRRQEGLHLQRNATACLEETCGFFGTEVPRVTFPSLERGSGLMTKADFLDFTYVGAALAFLVIMMVFLVVVIAWWQGKE
jgi:hypothetical protein